MGDSVYKVVGRHIRARRLQLGLTLEQLGEASGLSPSFIGQIERDVRKTSLEALRKIAVALRVPIGELFGRGPLRVLPASEKIENLLHASLPDERKVLLASLRHLARMLRSLR